MKKLSFYFVILTIGFVTKSFAQLNNISSLKLEDIMKGKEFIGFWPENIAWHVGGESILFDWNPENELEMSRYSYSVSSKKIIKLGKSDFLNSIEHDPEQSMFNIQYFSFNGNLWSYDKSKKVYSEIIRTETRIFNIHRVTDQNKIAYQQGDNLFLYDSKAGTIRQLTYFKKGKSRDNTPVKNELSFQQEELFKYIQEDIELNDYRKQENQNNTKEKSVFLDKRQVDYLVLSKDERFIFVRLGDYPENKNTIIEHHISKDGYTYTTNERPKVGEIEPIHTFGILDLSNDSLSFINFNKLTNIRKKPEYLKEYGDTNTFFNENRKIIMHRPIESKFGNVVLDIRSYDNKDRWLVEISPDNNDFTEIDSQHDEAWIGGPGISSWNMSKGVLGFYSETNKLYFQSEKTGYSHLYSFDFKTKSINQLTEGKFEVHDVKLSKDLSTFYLLLNKTHPGDRGYYKLDSKNNKLTPILSKSGAYEVSISPDEKHLAYLFSDKTNPWELFVAKNESVLTSIQITNSKKEAFKKYEWSKPEVITFKGKDEINVYARLYKSSETNEKPAVLFVHGAGYLQNAHNYWSNYYREFMFHNLLKDNGFTVLDIDYRASEGYGRDYRTAIYRHMGGMDLEDQISGKNFLVDSLNINPEKIGIYGGSYGGFITLMALLTKPDEFACGAALRSVTDWMHYNHEYTSNILNYPNTDSIAYRQSSPIYFAENLNKPLLILHGMVDNNVQFQDVVRLNQRFIELGKTNWEMAIFPVEAHGFTKSYSWFDEYRRIFELFSRVLKDE